MKKRNILFLLIGILFGTTLMKADAVSWFRMQEMFRFQGFQMFGIFMTAIPTAALSLFILKKLKIKTLDGEPIHIKKKEFNWGYIYGSVLFGIGWGLTGACPGPIYVQIGSGVSIAIVTLLSALAGTWVYSYLKPRLPH
ncbi:MAG: DUF6691 family protein [Ginsengibacter sp.]|jgi:hypothetical protein